MEYSKDSASTQFDFTDIQKALITQLEKSRQQSPDSFSKEIHVLAAVNDEIEGQLERQLQQERKDHIGKRILLIPCCLEKSHWVGILIEFQATDQILRAEYIDPVSRCDVVPDRLRKQLAKVCPSAVLQPKARYKHIDQRFSSALTIKNLLTAAENDQCSSFNNPERCSTANSSSSGNEGNGHTLAEKQQELKRGLEKFKIRNIGALSQKIQRTEERIREYEEEERIDDVEEETTILKELHRLQNLANEIVVLTQVSSVPDSDVQLKVRQMKEEVNNELRRLKIRDIDMLLERIQKTEVRIRQYEEEERMDIVEKETVYLKELQRLQTLANEINGGSVTSALGRDEPIVPKPTDSNIGNLDDRRKKPLYINDLRAEVNAMSTCARKTVIELLAHFEQKLLGENIPSQNQGTVMSSLQKLKDQVKTEELLSDDIKTILNNLEKHFNSENYPVIVHHLNELLKRFRSLNVPEIQRLVGKATEAAHLIQDKDIVLLIGATGSDKSTTVQFLAGAQMKKVRVEVRPGQFLEHMTAVGPIKNPDLKNVISSPLPNPETRYIVPVTVQLKDVLGAHESGTITRCDAPGFGDAAGPEVDIANSIGAIEALKRAKSVKILALLSYKSLGDRGRGVHTLAHILISMIHEIEDKLDAIVYAFPKFPPSTNINALLVDIKRSKIDEDATLRSDTAFVSVLTDMIEKTEEAAFRIEPTRDDPKKLMRKLKNVRGIRNPAEVFQFSMSEETRATISDHVQRDKFSIICAMKRRDTDLVLYYLNDLQILKDLLKESFIRDAYHESVRFVSESISNYCTETMKKFNRTLNSQDGLLEEDILDYQTSMKYLEYAQTLKEHLGSSLLSPASMLKNIVSELNERSRHLNEEELHSPLK